MKIGYPCINLSIDHKSTRTFRLASYTEDRLIQTIESNLNGLLEILKFNLERNLLFFRISSDLIPFASHKVNNFNWQKYFKDKFGEIGDYIKDKNMRISMHPGQFVLLTSPKDEVYKNSISELLYHLDILNLLCLDNKNKIQIHVGGAYGDKEESIKKFIKRYKELPEDLKEKLVIENDDRIYSVNDCYQIFSETGIPIIFDNFHHSINHDNLDMKEAAIKAFSTWDKEKDGIPMIDYSTQEPERRIGNHTQTIDLENFKSFLKLMKGYDFDIMLEIKDKNLSAVKAVKYIE